MYSMINKLDRIVKGWKNAIWTDVEVEHVAAKRAMQCACCEHAVEGKFEVIKEKKIEELKGMICNLCLCPLTTKLRSPEETCPKNKW